MQPTQNFVAVERVRGIDDRTLYREFVDAKRPVIIEDACARWSALKTWSLQDLRNKFGSRPITLDGKATTLETALSAIADSRADAPAPYLRECYLPETLPELIPEVSPVPGDTYNRLRAHGLLQMNQARDRGPLELLVAGRGASFPVLHYDSLHFHAFITQLQGSKTFWLYPPEQGRFLYPRSEAPNISRIDRFDPVDLDRWPDYANANSTRIEVHPGETIFVPSGFWHRTRVPDLSIAVTWNSVSRINWDDFVEDKYLQWSRGSPLKLGLKRAYFSALDTVLRLRGS